MEFDEVGLADEWIDLGVKLVRRRDTREGRVRTRVSALSLPALLLGRPLTHTFRQREITFKR